MHLSDIEEIAAMLLYEARKARDRGMQLEEFADGARQQAVDEWPQRTDFFLPVRHIAEWEPVIERNDGGS
jgi:hypothetical protein